jgi:hypothetical protein
MAIFLILIFGFVSAADYYISDLVIPKVAYEDYNINIEIDLVNNSTNTEDLDLNVYFYSPSGAIIREDNLEDIDVNANSTFKKVHTIIVTDSNASNSPHLIRAIILDSDDNPSNNMMQKWITVSKGQRKTPVPDMPIALGLVAGILVLFFISKKK